MIGITIYTADETGCEKQYPHSHEININLETECVGGLCDMAIFGKIQTINENCPMCHGSGLIPSLIGLKVLEFIKKYGFR